MREADTLGDAALAAGDQGLCASCFHAFPFWLVPESGAKKRIPPRRAAATESFTIGSGSIVLSTGLLAPGSFHWRCLPVNFTVARTSARRLKSPVTAAGPPRIQTVFRYTDSNNFYISYHKCLPMSNDLTLVKVIQSIIVGFQCRSSCLC